MHEPNIVDGDEVRGFTLVELSIVLVIIGLIVGGVVGGQSLIKSSKLQRIGSEINALKVAVNAYDLQFDALPGDHLLAQSYFGVADCPNGGGGTNPCNGNGNGKIADSGGYEDTREMQHLKLAGMLNSVELYTSNGGGGIYKSGWGDEADYIIAWGSAGHRIYFAKNGSSGGYYRQSILTAQQAKKIDVKYDDGNSGKGKVRGHNCGGGVCGWISGDKACVGGASTYRFDNEGVWCIISFGL